MDADYSLWFWNELFDKHMSGILGCPHTFGNIILGYREKAEMKNFN